ncbi:MAG: SEC-C metal-binding domain-containing protein, partial [Pseudomonadota bacterium]
SGMSEKMRELMGLDLPLADWAAEEGVANAEIAERVSTAATTAYEEKVERSGTEAFRSVEKQILLQVMDRRWQQHLQQIDQLRSVIHLRSYGQRNPLNEFKEEAFKLFYDLLADLRTDVTRFLMKAEIQPPQPQSAPQAPAQRPTSDPAARPVDLSRAQALSAPQGVVDPRPKASAPPATNVASKTPRNAPCPCGSGKKYKHCHGSLLVASQKA